MKISEIIKQRRLDLNLTQEQVAEKILVSTKSISNWENNKNFPDIESLIRLAKLYNLSLDNLLLEGSDIMNDIKKKEKLYELEKVRFIGPQLTNIILSFMIFLPLISKDFQMSPYMNILMIFLLLSNCFTLFYFCKKIDKYDVSDNRNVKFKVISITLNSSLILGYFIYILHKFI